MMLMADGLGFSFGKCPYLRDLGLRVCKHLRPGETADRIEGRLGDPRR